MQSNGCGAHSIAAHESAKILCIRCWGGRQRNHGIPPSRGEPSTSGRGKRSGRGRLQAQVLSLKHLSYTTHNPTHLFLAKRSHPFPEAGFVHGNALRDVDDACLWQIGGRRHRARERQGRRLADTSVAECLGNNSDVVRKPRREAPFEGLARIHFESCSTSGEAEQARTR